MAAAVVLAGGPAAAGPGGQPAAPAPGAAAADVVASDGAKEPAVAGERELGARLGLVTGGRVTPGGVRVAGVYLYQLSSVDWFEGALAFTFGSGDPACFRDREGALLCDHGALSGAGIGLAVGVRRFLTPQQGFAPYIRVQLGVGVAQFSDDGVRGLTLPAVVGVGVRARLGGLVAVGADAGLEAGVGLFGGDLGVEPHLGLQVAGVVELSLR